MRISDFGLEPATIQLPDVGMIQIMTCQQRSGLAKCEGAYRLLYQKRLYILENDIVPYSDPIMG